MEKDAHGAGVGPRPCLKQPPESAAGSKGSARNKPDRRSLNCESDVRPDADPEDSSAEDLS